MITETAFQDVAEIAKAEFTQYLERKLPRITKLFTHFPADSLTLHAHVQHFRHHDAFEVRLHLSSPLKSDCASVAVSHLLDKALDVAFDKLESQVVRALERLKERS